MNSKWNWIALICIMRCAQLLHSSLYMHWCWKHWRNYLFWSKSTKFSWFFFFQKLKTYKNRAKSKQRHEFYLGLRFLLNGIYFESRKIWPDYRSQENHAGTQKDELGAGGKTQTRWHPAGLQLILASSIPGSPRWGGWMYPATRGMHNMEITILEPGKKMTISSNRNEILMLSA